MPHKHSIYDSDSHFIIDPKSREIINLAPHKITLIKGDHNSERFTFEVPRIVEGHDMSLTNKVEIHYDNIGKTPEEIFSDVYIAEDLQISTESEDVVIFSWLLSRNATMYEGIISFSIHFKCLTGENIDYKWQTGKYADISVGTDTNNSEQAVEIYTDNLEAWFNKSLGDIDTVLQSINEGGFV